MHLEPENLVPDVHRTLKDLAHQLWLSPVSVWELSLLVEKGYVSLSQDMSAWVERSVKESGLREASFTLSVAARLQDTREMHRDLADRLLVATAMAYDLTLVTADHKLSQPIQGLNVLKNR